MSFERPPLVIDTGANPQRVILWLHGLGADGSDFADLADYLAWPDALPLRVILPHANNRPITINGGYRMPGWYDITSLDRLHRQEDFSGLEASRLLVEQLLAAEYARGVQPQHVVLGGFSQGGALSLFTGLQHSHTLAGVVGLSCYLPVAAQLQPLRHAANAKTPLWLAHGSLDPVVPCALGEHSAVQLNAWGYAVSWQQYPMQHSLAAEEMADLRQFMLQVLA